MSVVNYTPQGKAFTDLVLAVFRLNGRLLIAGDQMAKDFELSSARWQVLGAIIMNKEDLTVAQIARKIGLARQSVQRVVNELVHEGFITSKTNPDHARAYFLEVTRKGKHAFDKVLERQVRWANSLAESTSLNWIEAAVTTLNQFSDFLVQAEESANKQQRRSQ